MEILRAIGPPFLALVTVFLVDFLTDRRGLLPPAFSAAEGASPADVLTARVRRVIAMSLLWLVLWLGVFLPLGSLGLATELDFSQVSQSDLFLLHLLLALCLGGWYLCGFVPLPPGTERRLTRWSVQLGFRTDSVLRELGIGFVVGVLAWLAVLGVLLAVGLVIWWLGGEELLPSEPPAMIPWIAGLPIGIRLLISLSAGVVEETFFRGFLQPRVGLGLSTALFVLAHASYEQPLMLLGVTLLSLVYGGLVYWRQSIWAAIAAHALFDAVQLLVVIPAALRVLPGKPEAGIVLHLCGLA
jgi:membrane protease YdiL (CAAX protease family)